MTITVTAEEAIVSLRRAQKLVDEGVIGQARSLFLTRYPHSDVPHFCAIGAIAADRLQPDIVQYSTNSCWNDGLFMSGVLLTSQIEFGMKIIEMNDRERLSFGAIADCLESELV